MDWSFWDVIYSLLVFFFWFMYIWIFISIFADILRRPDISGLGKAGWVILLMFIPLIGALIYLITRPRPVAEEREAVSHPWGSHPSRAPTSPTEEIARAHELLERGAINQEEFQQIKQKALAV